MLALAAALATFFLVPRGVSAGAIEIESEHMSWNISKGTYQLNLQAHILVNNPNYVNVTARLRSQQHPAACDCPLLLPPLLAAASALVIPSLALKLLSIC